MAIASFQDAAALDRTFKLASNKLAAARQRIAAHAATVTASKDDAASKSMAKDPHASASSLASGAAPSGTLSSSGTAATGTVRSTASATKVDPSSQKKNTRKVGPHPKSAVH